MFHPSHPPIAPFLKHSPHGYDADRHACKKGPRAFQEIANVYRGKPMQPDGEKDADLQNQPTECSYSEPSRHSEAGTTVRPIEMIEFDEASSSSYHSPPTLQSYPKEPSTPTPQINTKTHTHPPTSQNLPPPPKQPPRITSLPITIEQPVWTERQLNQGSPNQVLSIRVAQMSSLSLKKSVRINNITSIQNYLTEELSHQHIDIAEKGKHSKLSLEEHMSGEQTPSQELSHGVKIAYIDYASDRYYLEPIRKDAPLHCIVKRQRYQTGDKYKIYEAATLKNFISVVKDKQGYTMISNHERQSMLNLIGCKQQIVIAKLIPNFFSNQFTTYLCETLYKKNEIYAVETSKCHQAITIDYQTSLFGLAGPRKISAYVPCEEGNITITGNKNLQELYEKERKTKNSSTIIKFKSKVPEWNKGFNGYALNFGTKPIVSSIKNFILVADIDSNSPPEAACFGKFSKDLFSLDIRHPLNIVQGISLAISSLDRKIA